MLDFIKADRKLTLNFWRYRLLHWVFDQNITRPEDSDLPQFLYTHYCPMFHLTNILVLCFPIILIAKMVVPVVIFFINCVLSVLSYVKTFVPEPEYNEQQDIDSQIEKETIFLKKRLLQDIKRKSESWVSSVINTYVHILELKYLQDNDVRKVFEELQEELKLAREEGELRRAERYKKFAFWIRASELIVKALTGILIAVVATVVSVILYHLVPAALYGFYLIASGFISFAINASVTGVFITTMKLTIALMILVAGCWILHAKFPRILKFFMTPINIMGEIGGAIATYAGEILESSFDFVKALYEDNCPKITIKED